jgi:hypothetical protein
MRKRYAVAAWIAVAGSLALAAGAGAAGQEQKAAPPPMSPEEQAMMAAWMKAMTPAEQHHHLAALAGNWEGSVTMFMAPGAPPQVNAAKVERVMQLGGRVLQDHWNGTMNGMPFEGMGWTGYDNAAQRWWTSWSDNFSTGVMNGTGKCDADAAKGCTYMSTAIDPTTGKEMTSRSTVSWPGADEERMQMFGPGPDGKEFMMMEIVIHRVK